MVKISSKFFVGKSVNVAMSYERLKNDEIRNFPWLSTYIIVINLKIPKSIDVCLLFLRQSISMKFSMWIESI